MKKLGYILFLLITFLCYESVKASCSYEDFAKYNRAALDIKTSYEFKETKDDTGYITEFFKISAINVPETLYVVVTGDNGTKNTLTPDSTGVVSFPSYSLGSVVNFKFEIYTSNNTSCPNEKVNELHLKKPMLNPYYSTGYCLADPENSFCDRFVFQEVKMEDYDKFAKTTRDNKKKENEELRKEEEKDDSPNKIYIIAGVSFGVLIIGYIGYRIIKRRGQRL